MASRCPVWLGLQYRRVGRGGCSSSPLLDALLGVALGLLGSAFARTEFQAVQFMPVIVLPQLLLCGLFVPRDEMATVLRWVSDVMPLSYAVEALNRVTAALSGDG